MFTFTVEFVSQKLCERMVGELVLFTPLDININCACAVAIFKIWQVCFGDFQAFRVEFG